MRRRCPCSSDGKLTKVPRFCPSLAAFVAAAIGLSTLLSSASAQAFCRSTTCRGRECERDEAGCSVEGLPLVWATSCLSYSFSKAFTRNLPHDRVREVVRRSFASWAAMPCGGQTATLTFEEGDDSACGVAEFSDKGENINLIIFRDDDFPYNSEDNTLAKTTVTFDVKTGLILDADIEVNTAFNEVTLDDGRVVYDLQSIMTHEIGHLMGIAHTPVLEATMFASYEPGQTSLRTLSQDDVDAACAIYPPSREATCDATPRNGLKVCPEAGAAPEAEGDGKGCSVSRGADGAPWLSSLIALSIAARAGRRHHQRRPCASRPRLPSSRC